MTRKWMVVVAIIVGVVFPLAAAMQRPIGTAENAGRTHLSSPGSMIETATMSGARAAHTATALRDGRVLVAGGFPIKGPATDAEIYDPVAARFLALPPMVTTRHSHTATQLLDGRVLIAGGYDEHTAPLAAAEIFDPATNSFALTSSLLSARAGHVAVLLDTGKVLIVGGVGPNWEFLSSAELYDPATGRFSSTGRMSVPRESHVGVRLQDGRVLVAGGHEGRGADLRLHASAEIYVADTGLFVRAGEMGVPRHKHDGVLLPDGQVLITGGSNERDANGVYDSSEIFDPQTASFSPGPAMKLGHYKHAGSSVVLPNGLVLVAGGAPQAELYDPRNRAFTIASGEARMAGHFCAVAPLPQGRVLVTGGYGNDGRPRPSAWLFRP